MTTESVTHLSRRRWPWKQHLLIMGIGTACAAMIPPLQSPDEADHVERAALLAHGQLVLETPPDHSSGGMVDSGLVRYLNTYAVLWYHQERKVTPELNAAAEDIAWSGKQVYRSAPGTGYYFPGIYVPQALGLKAGQLLGLSVDGSYRLARTTAMLCASALLILAFKITAPSLFTLALLILPMTLFQFASATIDATSIALTALALSVTFKTAQTRRISFRALLALSFSVFLVITSRLHMLPLLLLLPAVYALTRNRAVLVASAFITATTMAWLYTAMHRTVDLRFIQTSPTDAVLYYLSNPSAFVKVFVATLNNSYFSTFYQESFLGILGWLDTRFPSGNYTAFGGLLLGIALLSVNVPHVQRKSEWVLRGGLIITALISYTLVFFLIFVTNNPVGSKFILGVQGRYFLLPALVISYAMHHPVTAQLRQGTLYRSVALALLCGMGLLVANAFPKLMIERYTLTSVIQGASNLRSDQ